MSENGNNDNNARILKRKLKKQDKRERQKTNIRLAFQLKYIESSITIKDIRNVLHHCLSGESTPKWLEQPGCRLAEQLVVVWIDGIDEELLMKYQNLNWFRHYSTEMNLKEAKFQPMNNPAWMSLTSPGDSLHLHSAFHALFHMKHTNTQAILPTTNLNDIISMYILPPEMLLLYQYPMNTRQISNMHSTNFWRPYYIEASSQISLLTSQVFPHCKSPFEISPLLSPSDPFFLIALDCEMCYTTRGLDVTRISLVDQNENVCCDFFIIPDHPIIDYNTKYSGITEDSLRNITKTRQDALRELATLLTSNPNVVLVGHSLDHDLRALNIAYPWIIDTSLLYPHHHGIPYKSSLKNLVQRHLHLSIQEDTSGHCSVQDAIACIRLVKLMVDEPGNIARHHQFPETIFSFLKRNEMSSEMIDLEESLKYTQVIGHPIESDSEAMDETLECIERMKTDQKFCLLTARFPDLERNLHTVDLEKTIININDRLQVIYDALPLGSLFIVISGKSDLKNVKSLMRQACQARFLQHTKPSALLAEDDKWTDSKAEQLAQAIQRARQCAVLLTRKSL